MENSIHFVYGNSDFVATSINQYAAVSQDEGRYTMKACLHADDLDSIKDFVEKCKKVQRERKLLVLDNLQYVNEENIRNLDFIFRLSDHNRIIHNLDLFLSSDKSLFSDSDETIPSNEGMWRTYLAGKFTNNVHNFNGIAFSGRIQQFHINEYAAVVPNQQLSLCDSLRIDHPALILESTSNQMMSLRAPMGKISDQLHFILAICWPLTMLYHIMVLFRYF